MSKSRVEDSFLPPRWILTLLGAGFLVWLLFELKELLVLLVVGYSVAYVLDPVLDWLERRKISRPIGVGVIFAAIAGVTLILAITAVPTLLEEYRHLSVNLSAYWEQARGNFDKILESLKSRLPMGTSLSELDLSSLPTLSGETLNRIGAGILGFLLQGYSITLTILNLALVPFIVFYLAVDLDHFHRWIMSLVPKSYRYRTEEIFNEMDGYISAFVKSQLLVSIALFSLYAIGFGALGVKLWFLLAVISGFGNLVPYLGTVCGLVLGTVLSLVTFGDFNHLLALWAVFGVVQLLEGFLITPKLVGDQVGLSPLVVIIAIFVGGQLFGLVGIFLAIPGAAVVRVLSTHLHRQVVKSIDKG